MRRNNVDSLRAFVAVARERSFTKTAAQLGVSQSALSYTVRTLEERLGLRLLTRTTRSVSLTDAGERLFRSAAPRFDDIERELAALSALREKPAGTVRITSVEHAAQAILWPALARLLRAYADINVEIISDYRLTDLAAERFDAGVRLGEQVDRDMIAVRIGPDLRMAVVASPSYLDGRPRPLVPQDLTEHSCSGLRLPTNGGLYAWEFRQGTREVNVRIQGRVVSNTVAMMRQVALDGLGSPTWPRTWRTTPSVRGGWCKSWRTGAPPAPATISITRAAASLPRLSRSWSRRCAALPQRLSGCRRLDW